MKTLLMFICMLLTPVVFASGQSKNDSRGEGYLFFAPGVTDGSSTGLGSSGTIHIGGGGEGFVYKGLGLGAEIGALGPWSNYSDGVKGLGSANLSYHFLPKTKEGKVEPFVTAGYSILVRAGTSHGTNFGGGANVWLRDHLALRFEVRDGIFRDRGLLLGSEHHVGFRIGVTVR